MLTGDNETTARAIAGDATAPLHQAGTLIGTLMKSAPL
jgi:magnesium-transporting ATPase (P-type)